MTEKNTSYDINTMTCPQDLDHRHQINIGRFVEQTDRPVGPNRTFVICKFGHS